MIVHSFQTHVRDRWCLRFHIDTYLRFCDWVVVAVDEPAPEFMADVRSISPRIAAVEHWPAGDGIPADRIFEHGMFYDETAIRQRSLDMAMTFNPTLIVFGDTDEVPTPDVIGWAKAAADLPQEGKRWYCDWVNLFGDYAHAIGGGSAWSYQNPRGNKKCLAMQVGGDMRYRGDHHTGMEPGRASGGPAPTREGHHLIDAPKLLHLKYGWSGFGERPESKLPRHQPGEMLRNGEVVEVPAAWSWEGMPR